MHLHPASYKFHLAQLNTKTNKTFKFKVGTFGLAVLTLGIYSAYLYWDHTTQAPLRAQTQYLQKIAVDFNNAQTQLAETQGTFQIAGTKIKVVDNLKEATAASRGFWASLDDIEKIANNLATISQNVQTELAELQKLQVPEKFESLNANLTTFYQTTAQTLQKAYEEQLFTKDITLAISSDFYLTPISDETMWRQGNKKEIIAYYEAKKIQASTSLSALAKLSAPEEFKPYLGTQIAYLTLLVNTSDKIIRILQAEDDSDSEKPTQVEIAYQELNSAKIEHEKLAIILLAEKLRVFDIKRNYERFVQVKLIQNSLQGQISEAQANQTQPKQIWPKFLQALQIPSTIW